MKSILQKFASLRQSQPMNDLCADCGLMKGFMSSKTPKSKVSYVCMKHYLFLCEQCALIHQEILPEGITDIKPLPDVDAVLEQNQFDASIGIGLEPESMEEVQAKIQKQIRHEQNQILLIEQWGYLEDLGDQPQSEEVELAQNQVTFNMLDKLTKAGNQKFLQYMQNYYYFSDEIIDIREANEKGVWSNSPQVFPQIIGSTITEQKSSEDSQQENKQESEILNSIIKLKDHIQRKYNSRACEQYRTAILGHEKYVKDELRTSDSNCKNGADDWVDLADLGDDECLEYNGTGEELRENISNLMVPPDKCSAVVANSIKSRATLAAKDIKQSDKAKSLSKQFSRFGASIKRGFKNVSDKIETKLENKNSNKNADAQFDQIWSNMKKQAQEEELKKDQDQIIQNINL